LGARDLEQDHSLQRRFLFVSAGAAAAALLAFAAVVHFGPAPPFDFALAVIQLALTWFGMLCCALLLVSHRTTIESCALLLLAIAVFDASLTLTIVQPVMYSSATRDQWQYMTKRHVAGLELEWQGIDRHLQVPGELATPGYPNNRNIALKVPVLHSYTTFLNRFELFLESDPGLAQFALGQNRMWFAEDAVAAAPTDRAFTRFVDALRKNQAPTLVVHTPQQMKAFSEKKSAPGQGAAEVNQDILNLDQVPPASIAEINSVSYWPNSLQFRFDAPKPGWLMVTDRWAPGWKAEVNGKPAEVYGADFLFRAVRVDAGVNTVTFRYKPRTWLVSILVSWGTLLLFVIASGLRFVQGRRHAMP
jgi:hypothetical protein